MSGTVAACTAGAKPAATPTISETIVPVIANPIEGRNAIVATSAPIANPPNPSATSTNTVPATLRAQAVNLSESRET